MDDLLLQALVILVLLVVGFSLGRLQERRHLRDIEVRERRTSQILVTDVKTTPPGVEPGGAQLVMGDVVIASDYFKSFVAGLRGVFGGELRTYQSLLVRARREAMLRMVEQAQRLGSPAVIGIRFETAEVGGPMSEILCYGTALLPADRVREPRSA